MDNKAFSKSGTLSKMFHLFSGDLQEIVDVSLR